MITTYAEVLAAQEYAVKVRVSREQHGKFASVEIFTAAGSLRATISGKDIKRIIAVLDGSMQSEADAMAANELTR